MSDTESFSPPQPAPQHLALQKNVGTWKVACEFFMGPDQPPMETEGRETVEAFGPFWITSEFEGDMFGMPFRGRSTLGYDAAAQRYESTWIDTMSSVLFRFSGDMDASAKVLEMSGEATELMSGQPALFRTREEWIADDERVFEMFMTLPGQDEVRLMRNRYTR